MLVFLPKERVYTIYSDALVKKKTVCLWDQLSSRLTDYRPLETKHLSWQRLLRDTLPPMFDVLSTGPIINNNYSEHLIPRH